MTEPAPSPAAGQPPVPHRPMPRLGVGVHWPTIAAEIDRDLQRRLAALREAVRDNVTEVVEAPPTPSLGATGSSLGDEAPVVDVTKPGFGIVSIEEARSWGITPPPAVELLAMADDLNAHGGLDETFVAGLLKAAADPLADAKRGLGIVDPEPPPVTTTKPITYESIVEALEKITPLGPQRLDVVKLTQEQIDAVTATQPHAVPSAEPWHFFGTPVEVVDTVEESTPYQLTVKPSRIISTDKTLTDDELERLRTDWLRALDAKPVLSQWIVDADREFVAHVNDGVDKAALLDAIQAEARRPSAHQHIWTTTSPVRCVECRRYLRPWWRRALDRVRRGR